MYYQWADDTDHIIEEGRYGTYGKGKKYGIEGILSLEPLYVSPEAWEREVDVDECPEVDGYRVVYPDKLISFESKRTDQFGLRLQIQTPVFSNPALTYSQVPAACRRDSPKQDFSPCSPQSCIPNMLQRTL